MFFCRPLECHLLNILFHYLNFILFAQLFNKKKFQSNKIQKNNFLSLFKYSEKKLINRVYNFQSIYLGKSETHACVRYISCVRGHILFILSMLREDEDKKCTVSTKIK